MSIIKTQLFVWGGILSPRLEEFGVIVPGLILRFSHVAQSLWMLGIFLNRFWGRIIFFTRPCSLFSFSWTENYVKKLMQMCSCLWSQVYSIILFGPVAIIISLCKEFINSEMKILIFRIMEYFKWEHQIFGEIEF